jgi:putative aminopeptidase FrvX
MELLKKLCSIHAPSGEESELTNFLVNYFLTEQDKWKCKPKLYYGKGFRDNLIAVFGHPKTAVFAHMDSTGFSVRYKKELISIGSPEIIQGTALVGKDEKGTIQCNLNINEEDNIIEYNYHREISRGTSLTFKPLFKTTKDYIEANYLDNRLGIRNALALAECAENVAIVFSCGEEHGGGSVELLSKFLHENFRIEYALISDITWASSGIMLGNGIVISIRDKMIPRKKFVNKIIELAKNNNINFQLEVESSGSSDGGYLHKCPYPIDWCFIGIAAKNVHSPTEIVYKRDIIELEKCYKILIDNLQKDETMLN